MEIWTAFNVTDKHKFDWALCLWCQLKKMFLLFSFCIAPVHGLANGLTRDVSVFVCDDTEWWCLVFSLSSWAGRLLERMWPQRWWVSSLRPDGHSLLNVFIIRHIETSGQQERSQVFDNKNIIKSPFKVYSSHSQLCTRSVCVCFYVDLRLFTVSLLISKAWLCGKA